MFGRFVPSIAYLAARVNVHLRNDKPEIFGPLHEKESVAVASLKELLTSTLLLVLQRSNFQYKLDTDTFDKRSGCVLFLEQENGSSTLIGYRSPTLNDTQQELVTTHRERLAVAWVLSLLHPYLKSGHLKIRTDSEALQWIRNMIEDAESWWGDDFDYQNLTSISSTAPA